MSIQTYIDADHHADRRDRRVDLDRLFTAHASPAFHRLCLDHASDGEPDLPPSLDPCEKVGTSEPESPEGPSPGGVRDTLLQSLTRSDERQQRVLGLIEAEEFAAAKRLAYCGRQSVQLRCAHCDSTDNFVPITCDVRLCRQCARKRQGQAIGQYAPVVSQWDQPTIITLTDENAESVASIDDLRADFNRFRDRVIPTEGATIREGARKSWCWRSDGGEPKTDYWKQAWCAPRDSRARWRAAKAENEYVSEGKGIPVSELIRGGFYAFDIKEQEAGRYHNHIHILCDASYCPQPAYSAVWSDITGSPVVDVRRIDPGNEKSVENAIAEVVGYAAKPPEFSSVEAEVEYYAELKGSKLIQPFGDLHGNTPQNDEHLLCADCGEVPEWWDYLGLVDEAYDTMQPSWEEDADRPPPGSD